MAKGAEARVRELGLSLPRLPEPTGRYIGYRRYGQLLVLAGHVSASWLGVVGDSVDFAGGRRAARECGLALLARIREAEGSLDPVVQVLRMNVWVACHADFTRVPAIADAASDLLIDVFGADVGAHPRSALGLSSLPLGAAVSADLTVAVHDSAVPSRDARSPTWRWSR